MSVRGRGTHARAPGSPGACRPDAAAKGSACLPQVSSAGRAPPAGGQDEARPLGTAGAHVSLGSATQGPPRHHGSRSSTSASWVAVTRRLAGAGRSPPNAMLGTSPD